MFEGPPDSNIFLWIAASVADAAAVNRYGVKNLLANGLNTFSIKGNPILCNLIQFSYFMQLIFW